MKATDGVWITGVGCATSLGLDFRSLSDSLLAGRSGVAPVTHFDVSHQASKIASSLPPLTAPPGWDADDFAGRCHWDQLLLWCSVQALKDAGYWEERQRLRIGLVVGIGAEWLQMWEHDWLRGGNAVLHPELDGPGRVRSLWQALGLNGPSATVAAACASGNIALGVARQWLQQGWVDVCVAGGCDRSVTPLGLNSFGILGALTKRNDEPARASRPFDRQRDGFVLGEGGALMVLESASRAQQRGAPVYGEVLGFGASSDAFNQVMPSNDPAHAAQAITSALADARINPDDIDYINPHATSTPLGDIFETKALHRALGPAARTIPVSGTKSMTGHMVSAAAAVEAVACLAAFRHQTVPPTINLDEVDPECDLCHVPHQAQPRRVDTALSISFGFGGSNTALLLRRVA
jgi:3-oxoacyl-[acyl-carrier-protein] synthase II